MSVLQSLTLAFGLSEPHVRRLLAQAKTPPPGLYRRGGRGHWRVKGPLTLGRLERIRRHLGLKRARIYYWRLWKQTPEAKESSDRMKATMASIDAITRKSFEPLRQFLDCPKIQAAALAFDFDLAFKRGDGQPGGPELTEEDFSRPVSESVRLLRKETQMAMADPNLVKLATAARRLINGGLEATRENLAAAMGMDEAQHRAAFSLESVEAAQEIAEPRVDLDPARRKDEPQSKEAAELLAALRSLYRKRQPDSERNLAAELGLSVAKFRTRFSPQQIDEAYSLFEQDEADEEKRKAAEKS